MTDRPLALVTGASRGIGAAVAGLLISHFGYVPNAEQTPQALHGILLLSSLIPAVGLILLAFTFMIYGLNEHLCSTMREELAKRRQQHQQASEKNEALESTGNESLAGA